MIFLFLWIIIATAQAWYRFKFQYQKLLDKPLIYGKVKNALHYAEIVMLSALFYDGMENRLYWLILPLAFLLRFFVKFLAFKRESDKLYDMYVENKIGGSSKGALDLANMQINRDIESGERF